MTTLESPSTALTSADRARILSHMNEDHADAVLAYARQYGAISQATSATLAALDAQGMDLVVTTAHGDQALHLSFAAPLADAHAAHLELVRMAKEATAALRATAASAASAASSASTSPAPDAKKAAALERARSSVLFLRDTLKTLQLGTVAASGEPDCSVAPYVVAADGSLLTYISELSTHTANLRATGRATALLIEDEATAAHLLARRRLTLACTATFIARDHADHASGMTLLRERFGPVMEHLEKMHDFHLVRLTPARARLVAGFGQAYDADPRDWSQLSHVNDVGHSAARARPTATT
jgi:heme iron utilization protein